MKNKRWCLAVSLMMVTVMAFGQNADKDKRLDWWREAKFGLFIHWGLYAVPAGEYKGQTHYGEWIMQEAHIPKAEYEKFAPQFNPVRFNAEEWVRMAKAAGMKYIVITSKHHDGFCLWDSKVSDYDVMDRTPFKRDIMKELSDACKKYGLVFCMYHSIMDWHHPDAVKPNFAKYRDEYMKPQLAELVKRYDPGVLWFDGEWIDEWTEEQGRDLYNWLRTLKPDLIINNRVGKGRNGMQGMTQGGAVGDFGTPEQEILEEKSTLDWESCMTMNNHWGYNKNDNQWKTTNQLIWNLVDVVAKGGNYLLNVGPTAEGVFPDASIERLAQMGAWMEVNREAVYGLKTWDYFHDGEKVRYATDGKGQIYVYMNGWPGKQLKLRKVTPEKGSTLVMLGAKDPLTWRQTEDGLVINLPDEAPKTQQVSGDVYVLKMKGKAQPITPAPQVGTADEAAAKAKVIAGLSGTVTIQPAEPGSEIRYTTDGTEPGRQSSEYKGPITVSSSGVIKAVAYAKGKMPSDRSELRIVKGKYAISLSSRYAQQYGAYGPVTLVDGMAGDPQNYRKGWLGFEGVAMEAVIDLGVPTSFRKISASFLRNHGAWIFLPRQMKVMVSDDGVNFKDLGVSALPAAVPQESNGSTLAAVSQSGKARYIKLVAENIGQCPSWHPGAGGKAWIFADEVTVE